MQYVVMTVSLSKTSLDSYEAAVQLEGRDVIVTANAGSGKTHLLVDRYFYLLSRGIHPRALVAFTFTEKAARQLKEKILQTLPVHRDFASLPNATLGEWRDQIHQAPIGTIHQFCLRVLQESSGEGGLYPGTIIDEATEIYLRESILNRILQESFELGGQASETLLPVYGMPGLRDNLRSVVTEIESFVEPDPYPPLLPELKADEKVLLAALLDLAQKVRTEMDHAKQRHHWLSFADLELKALDNLKHPGGGLQKFLSPLCHILVDEFQDTSPIQIAILEALQKFKATQKKEFFLFAVGDPKQSIYRFRKVDRRLVDKVQERVLKHGGQTFVLPKNYRSLSPIVDFANHFSTKAFSPVTPSHALRISEAQQVRVVRFPETQEAPGRASRQMAEAKWIAEKIFSDHQTGRPWESMAVLFRASASALPLIDQLNVLSIPFTLRGGRDLFTRQEILDFKNLLYFLANPQDNLFLIGVLRSPIFLLSDAALFILAQETGKDQGLFEYLLQTNGRPLPELLQQQFPEEAVKLRWTIDLLRSWVEQAPALSPHAFLKMVSNQLDLRRLYGEIGGDWEAPLAIEQFLSWLKHVESEMDRPNLTAVVSLLKQLAKTPVLKAPLGDLVEGSGCVHLLTIHSAKGLQFPTVFLLDLARPAPTFRESVQYRGGQWSLKIPGPEGDYHETPRFEAMKEIQVREEAEENKRLLYVALTRAQDELYIPLAAKTRGKNNLQSILLEHIPEDYLKNYLCNDPSISMVREHSVKMEQKPTQTLRSPALRILNPVLPHVTVSQMEVFAQCPLKYYFSYQQGLSDQEWNDPKLPNQTLLGTLLHRGLHHLRDFPGKSPSEIIQYLLQTEPLGDQEFLVAELSSHLENYLESEAYKKILHATEDHSELPFILMVKNAYLRGQLDRLVKFGGQWHLIDFKFSTKNKSSKQVQKDYGFQLMTYTLAARQFLQGTLPKVEVHLLGNSRALPVSFSECELTEHQQFLEQTIDRFQTTRLEEIQLHEACYSCPFNRTVPLCPVPKGIKFF